MLYDRPYMQNGLAPKLRSITDFLILFLIFCFIGQSILKVIGKELHLIYFLSLSAESLNSGFVWTFLTYSFLHEGPLHLLFNLLGIHFISRSTEHILTRERYVFLILTSVFLGSVCWSIVNPDGGVLIGASAFVMASLTYFCLLRPNEPITFLLFFVLPVSLKPKYLLLGVIGIEIYGFWFGELENTTNIAHSAHLGGMLAGFLLKTSFFKSLSLPKISFSKPKDTFTKKKSVVASKDYSINHELSRELEIQVDKILDKINEKGFGSLTSEEKALLEKAKSLFNAKPK